MNYTKQGNEIFHDGQKVAWLLGDGALRMTRGNAGHRADVEAFLSRLYVAVPPGEDMPEEVPRETTKPGPEHPPKRKAGEIPPCPVSERGWGDKDPEVIDWWFTYHPEEARERYKNRRGDYLDKYR